VAEPLTATAIIGAVTAISGSLPDIVQGVGEVADWVKAQEGVRYNVLTFSLPEARPQPEPDPASLARVGKVKHVVSLDPTFIEPQIRSAPLLRLDAGKETILLFRVGLLSRSKGAQPEMGYTFLSSAEGFASAIGDQAEVEFSGEEWKGMGYLLAFKGFVNPMGSGFDQFSGSVVINFDGRTTPQHCALARSGRKVRWNALTGYQISVAGSAGSKAPSDNPTRDNPTRHPVSGNLLPSRWQ
jgi:hypothetical protein